MQFRFSLDEADCRRWLLDAAHAFEGAGHGVSFAVRAGAGRKDTTTDALLAAEARLYRLEGLAPWAPLAPASLPVSATPPEVEIELSGPPGTGLALRIGADFGLGALPRSLRTQSSFEMALVDAKGAVAASGIPARGDADSLTRSLAEVTLRIVTLCCMAADGQGALRPVPASPPPVRAQGAAGFLLGATLRKGLARLAPSRFQHHHWRIGLRPRAGCALPESGDTGGFRWIADDGARYFADPLLVDHAGETFLFMEEYRHAAAKGVLALARLGADGMPREMPQTLLERAGHVSFPQVFEHQGTHYLFMENANEGFVPLYRARRFPDAWEEVAPLIDVPLHDPVLFEHGGRFWLLGNLTLGGSTNDVLAAYHAPGPLGPFTPHVANPLLVDARQARAGGRMIEAGGTLLRVAQDCCAGYGQALHFGAVSLDPARGLSLGPGRMVPPPALPGVAGMHSYSRSARFEAIDILTAPDWKPA